MKILVIRRDNIGDLVCTTPLVHALREKYPDAFIALFVNSYNEPVVADNPDVDAVFAYTKAKHSNGRVGALRVYIERLKLLWRLRRMKFDYAIAACCRYAPRAIRLARLVGARHSIGFVEDGKHVGIDTPVSYGTGEGLHEVEDVFRLLAPLGIDSSPSALVLQPAPAAVAAARLRLALKGEEPEGIIGVHISARKVRQRWPEPFFVELLHRLAETKRYRFILFWSPGDEHNPHHPGDDRKAESIASACEHLGLQRFPTQTLPELIAGLSLCDKVICSDGGAMHVAAALGKPIVCFFGNSSAERWHPWGVPYELLQKPSQNVADISVDEAYEAYRRLAEKISVSGLRPS